MWDAVLGRTDVLLALVGDVKVDAHQNVLLRRGGEWRGGKVKVGLQPVLIYSPKLPPGSCQAYIREHSEEQTFTRSQFKRAKVKSRFLESSS